MITYEELFKTVLLFIVLIVVLKFLAKIIIESFKQDKYKKHTLKNLEKEIKKRLEKANRGGKNAK